MLNNEIIKKRLQDSVDDEEIEEIPQRLCSEIQLFELCDKNICDFKNGKFCEDETLLRKFEKIEERENIRDAFDDEDDLDDFEEYDEDGFSDGETGDFRADFDEEEPSDDDW